MTGPLFTPDRMTRHVTLRCGTIAPSFRDREGGGLATETTALAGLEPRAFWDHFERLTKIARPSRHEEPVIAYVRAWGEERAA